MFYKEGAVNIMDTEIHHILDIVGEKMTEDEVEMRLAEHEGSNGCITCEELAQMELNG